MDQSLEAPARRVYGRLPALDTPVVRIAGEGPRILAELVATLAATAALIPLAALLRGGGDPALAAMLAVLGGVGWLALKVRRQARSLLVLENASRTLHREIALPGFTLRLAPVRFQDLARVELQGSPRSEGGTIRMDARVVLVGKDGREHTVIPATRHEADAVADARALAEHLGLPLVTDDERRDEQEAIDREIAGELPVPPLGGSAAPLGLPEPDEPEEPDEPDEPAGPDGPGQPAD